MHNSLNLNASKNSACLGLHPPLAVCVGAGAFFWIRSGEQLAQSPWRNITAAVASVSASKTRCFETEEREVTTQNGILSIAQSQSFGVRVKLENTVLQDDLQVARFLIAFPAGSPQLVVVFQGYGGSSGYAETTLYDVAATKPQVGPFPVLADGASIESVAGGDFLISGFAVDETDDKGDHKVPIQFIYNPSHRMIVAKQHQGAFDYTTMVKRLPTDIFDNEKAREPLVAALGPNFKAFRTIAVMYDENRLIDGRYLIGSGVAKADQNGSFFAIDIAKGAVFAEWQGESGRQSAGTRFENASVKGARDEWEQSLSRRGSNGASQASEESRQLMEAERTYRKFVSPPLPPSQKGKVVDDESRIQMERLIRSNQ